MFDLRRTARRIVVVAAAASALLGSPTSLAAAAAPTAPTPADPATRVVTVRDVGLRTPESILFARGRDRTADRYLVSNVGGPSAADELAKDDNGFISRLRPDGTGVEARWIDGRKPNVRLDSPHGMGIVGDVLYVADLTTVRKFNRVTGAPLGDIPVPRSVFLNDLAVGPDGSVYVTDTGLTVSADGQSYVDTNPRSDAVYRISRTGAVSTVSAGAGLGHPNGITVGRTGQLRVTAYDDSGHVYTPGPNGTQQAISRFPAGALDGLVQTDTGLYTSSGADATVYKLDPAGRINKFFVGTTSGSANTIVADLGLDPCRQRLLMPLYYADALRFQPL